MLPRPLPRCLRKSTGHAAKAHFRNNVKPFDVSGFLSGGLSQIDPDRKFRKAKPRAISSGSDENGFGFSQGSSEERSYFRTVISGPIGPECTPQALPVVGVAGIDRANLK